MKKIIVIIAAFALMFAFSGCGTRGFDKNALSLSEYNGAEVNTQVQLFIKQRTVTSETEEAALSLVSLSDKDHSYDAVQRLEVELEGQWYVVPDKQDAVIMSIYALPAGGTEEDIFYFAGHYDKLPQGSYRIVKQLIAADGEIALAAAEFNI